MRLPVGTVHAWRWTSAVMVADIPNGRGEREADVGVLPIMCPSSVHLGWTSRLARRLTTILPAMTLAEAIETTCLPRAAGRTGGHKVLVTTRRDRSSL